MESETVTSALERLNAALDGLNRTVESRLQVQTEMHLLEEDLHLQQEDRAELANDLDHMRKRAEQVEQANEVVAKRLASAMECISTVLKRYGM